MGYRTCSAKFFMLFRSKLPAMTGESEILIEVGHTERNYWRDVIGSCSDQSNTRVLLAGAELRQFPILTACQNSDSAMVAKVYVPCLGSSITGSI
jgi:hypothetical protein